MKTEANFIDNEIIIGLICTSTSFGGLEINLIRLANWLSLRKNNVKLFLVKDSPLFTEAQKLNLPVIAIKKNLKYFDFLNSYKLSRITKKEKITHLLVHHTRDISLCAMAKFYFGANFKLIYQQQMQLGVDKKDILHTFRFNQLDSWVAPLEWLAKQTAERTKINPKKIAVIPLCIEIEKFSNIKSRKKEALDYFSLPDSFQYIGIIGRIDPHKGQKELIEAFNLLKNDNLRLLIVGEPTKNEGNDYYNSVLSTIKNYNLGDKVFIKPFTDKAELFFAAVDVFVMATKGETYGMVTVEAIASKCVVVGNNTGGTKDLIKPFCGELYKNGNLEDMASKIQKALENLTNYYPEPESSNYIKQFSHHVECERYEKLFEKLKN